METAAAAVTVKRAPNILIATESELEFKALKAYLQSVLGRNTYTIYRLNRRDRLDVNLWQSNCKLLVEPVNSGDGDDQMAPVWQFLNNGNGNVLTIPMMTAAGREWRTSDGETLLLDGSTYAFELKYYRPPLGNNVVKVQLDIAKTPNDELHDQLYLYDFREKSSIHCLIKV